jgi:hypothetical protein
MADGIDKDGLERLEWAQGNGVFGTLLEIAMALLIAIVLTTILGVLTF